MTPTDATDRTVIWEAAGGTYVTVTSVVVTQNGTSIAYIKGMKPGNTTVTAYTFDSSYQTTARITVSVNAMDRIDISHPNGLTLRVGEEFNLEATPVAADPSADPSYPSISWSSGDSSIVSVDQKGHIRALKAGTATITVSSVSHSGVKATCRVTVVDSAAGDNGHEGIGFEDWNF